MNQIEAVNSQTNHLSLLHPIQSITFPNRLIGDGYVPVNEWQAEKERIHDAEMEHLMLSGLSRFRDIHPDIAFDSAIDAMCRVGAREMSYSKDTAHDAFHIRRMLDYLTDFLQQNPHYKNNASYSFQNIVVSILWHDIWRSKEYDGTLAGGLVSQIREAAHATIPVNDYFISLDAMKRQGQTHQFISDEQRAQIRHIIETHPLPYGSVKRDPSAQMFFDIDSVDAIHPERFTHYFNELFSVTGNNWLVPWLQYYEDSFVDIFNVAYYTPEIQKDAGIQLQASRKVFMSQLDQLKPVPIEKKDGDWAEWLACRLPAWFIMESKNAKVRFDRMNMKNLIILSAISWSIYQYSSKKREQKVA